MAAKVPGRPATESIPYAEPSTLSLTLQHLQCELQSGDPPARPGTHVNGVELGTRTDTVGKRGRLQLAHPQRLGVPRGRNIADRTGQPHGGTGTRPQPQKDSPSQVPSDTTGTT